jgi:hypothetical protein
MQKSAEPSLKSAVSVATTQEVYPTISNEWYGCICAKESWCKDV